MAVLLVVGLGLAAPARATSIAFYYGGDLPRELLAVHDRVVVDADSLAQAGLSPAALAGERARLIAYVSVGELAPGMRPPAFRDDWVLGRNEAWQTDVLDLAHRGVRRYLRQRVDALVRQGYHGVFLDTLDSFRLAALAPERELAQVAALEAIIRDIAARHPDRDIVLNRGFEVLPRVAPAITAVVAESLFDRWDAAASRYTSVPEADRAWLVRELRIARDRYQLPVTVIDYRPPGQRAQARETARKIAALGFDPWITDAQLTALGVGAPEILSRRVLVLYDGAHTPLARSDAFVLLAPVLEHLGLVPDFLDVSHQALPREPLAGRYAGVVAFFAVAPARPELRPWLMDQLDGGVRVAFLGHLGVDGGSFVERLGLAMAQRAPAERGPAMQVTARALSPLVGFEAAPRAHRVVGPGLIARDPGLRVHLRVEDARGPLRDAVVTGPWGGMALAPHILREGAAGERAWCIDPFAFVREALALEPMPVVDVTTESGHRLLMMHVDGDGGEAPPDKAPGLEALRAFLARHALPHSTGEERLAAGIGHVVARAVDMALPERSPTRLHRSLTRLQPMAMPRAAGAVDVLWPLAGDAALARDDDGAPFGYRRVLEILELTDSPRRLAPAALRYRVAVAATGAGVAALDEVYAHLGSRELLPVLAWDWVRLVEGFRRATITRDLDGPGVGIRGVAGLHTVRIPPALGWPDPSRSRGLVAVRDLPQGRYVTLVGPDARLVLQDERPTAPVIAGATGRVTSGDLGRITARGHTPISLTIDNLPAEPCALRIGRARVRGRPVAGPGLVAAQRFDTQVTALSGARVDCARGAR